MMLGTAAVAAALGCSKEQAWRLLCQHEAGGTAAHAAVTRDSRNRLYVHKRDLVKLARRLRAPIDPRVEARLHAIEERLDEHVARMDGIVRRVAEVER